MMFYHLKMLAGRGETAPPRASQVLEIVNNLLGAYLSLIYTHQLTYTRPIYPLPQIAPGLSVRQLGTTCIARGHLGPFQLDNPQWVFPALLCLSQGNPSKHSSSGFPLTPSSAS